MFDIGFTELLLVGIVALIVVGPERLPSMIRTMLSYIRQFKSGFAHVKSEVERELELADMKKDLQSQQSTMRESVGLDELNESFEDLRQLPNDLNVTVERHVDDAEIEADLDQLAKNSADLPSPDAEADTGVEMTEPQTNITQKPVAE